MEFVRVSMGARELFPIPLLYYLWWDLPNGLHTDLKFQNQAIQCCLLEPRGMEYDRAVGRELHLSSVYATTRVYIIQYKLNYLDPSLKNLVSYSKLPT